MYAPPEKANPPELANYPGEFSGYQDEQGRFIKFEVRRELPESLPRNGRPPEKPYESVSAFLSLTLTDYSLVVQFIRYP